jgi:hypothetical protein
VRARELPFIPGIIVQSHKWSLVLSTHEGARTVLWTEWEFGNTQSLQNAYKVVAGLRELPPGQGISTCCGGGGTCLMGL